MTTIAIMTGFAIAVIVGVALSCFSHSRISDEDSFEFRKNRFPSEVRRIIEEYNFRKLTEVDRILYEGTTVRMIIILRGLGFDFLLFRRDEKISIVKYLKDHQISPEIVQQVEIDIKKLDELQKKIDEKSASTDTIFKKVFPRLVFEYWDLMSPFKKQTLVYEIIEGMENRGEL